MKSASSLFPAAGVGTLGLLAALTGCANTPTRLATGEATAAPALAASPGGNYEAPVPLHTVRPQYPFVKKRSGAEGVVIVHALIDETGKVLDAEVGRDTDLDFGPPALDAFKRWTFKPALRDGVPVAQRVKIPIHFTFTEG